ncbi:MAG: MotA/TolQ/ExbB proton channel family protein [Verrucomicrobiota bacterium]
MATSLLWSFERSDLQGKVIVIILAIGSALTWTLMLTKWQQFRRARKTGKAFLTMFRRERDPLQLFINNYEMADSPLYNIYRLGAEEVSSRFGTGRSPQRVTGGFKPLGNGPQLLELDTEVATAERGVVNLDTLRNALGRAIDTEVLKLENHISWLATAVQGGPFLGLLGSAWGVMSVFASMGIEGSVRLGMVAPGISAALLATVVGLLVAVPSLFAYNWIAQRLRQQTMEMENFADEFIAAVEHNYVTN